MKWTENETLAPLMTGEDEDSTHTTYERLCYHLVHDHGYPSWVVVQRFQVELETMHNNKHAYECNHSHTKTVRIVGYEPRK